MVICGHISVYWCACSGIVLIFTADVLRLPDVNECRSAHARLWDVLPRHGCFPLDVHHFPGIYSTDCGSQIGRIISILYTHTHFDCVSVDLCLHVVIYNSNFFIRQTQLIYNDK